MLKKIIRIVLTIAGISTGVAIATSVSNNIELSKLVDISINEMLLKVIFVIFTGLILGLFIYLLSPFFIDRGQKLAKYIEKEIAKMPGEQIIRGVLGLVSGFILAFVFSGFIKNLIPIPALGSAISVVLYIFLGYLGIRIASDVKFDISKVFDSIQKLSFGSKEDRRFAKPKVLDTSVIIDGRILDICRINFIEGQLIVPEFVLKELRHIADSADSLKRQKGRRGLDILKKLQTEMESKVVIDNTDFGDTLEVDIKLIKLAEKLNGMVATHDYNLNKVADLHGVEVLNINELANAVKPIVIPGEEMTVKIVKEGKENNQGLAYLEDGTMIVVANGKNKIGKTVDTTVTKALQTAAGKMIFVEIK